MTPAAKFLHEHGNAVLPVKLAPFDTVGDGLFDQRLAALKCHCEDDGLTATSAVLLLDTWSDVLADAARHGKVDAFLASRTIGILKAWIGQYDDAIRARAAA